MFTVDGGISMFVSQETNLKLWFVSLQRVLKILMGLIPDNRAENNILKTILLRLESEFNTRNNVLFSQCHLRKEIYSYSMLIGCSCAWCFQGCSWTSCLASSVTVISHMNSEQRMKERLHQLYICITS